MRKGGEKRKTLDSLGERGVCILGEEGTWDSPVGCCSGVLRYRKEHGARRTMLSRHAPHCDFSRTMNLPVLKSWETRRRSFTPGDTRSFRSEQHAQSSSPVIIELNANSHGQPSAGQIWSNLGLPYEHVRT
jgi:hypothetical protein